ncbi:aldose 1-epimerase [Wielerella bovis]|uniref:aldose 1-epimerase n=1 Tax=Wielerella bovis TaxID=2917790 RepID=UPI0020185501|nr:aldose 1-epimerase [Wielerella bovis]ULJ59486.1 aldose 1-epimerase [Wielerella bovis]
MFSLTQHPDRIILSDDAQQYQAEIFPFGALLNRFAIKKPDQNWHNIIAAFQSPEDARTNITQLFRSAKLSPFVCRLANAQYEFSGCHYQTHKHKIGDSAIHGLIYDAEFTVQQTHADAQHASLTLSHTYQHDIYGYPFDYQINITYTLREHGALHLHTEIHNIGDQPLPIADGWHPYFAVDGNMANWQLHIRSCEQLEFSPALLPTGKRIADATFSQATPIAQTELDNCFVLTEDFSAPAVVLQGEHIQLRIMPDAAYPYVQVYTPPQRDCIALENLSSAPDAFNNHIGLIELAAGEKCSFNTLYQLEYL